VSDDAKKTILSRRARFIAAAIAGTGIACGKDNASPQPCLEVAYEPPDGGADAARPPPRPCLSPALPRDASAPTPHCAPGDPLCAEK
jgi:hypothetical protein